MTNSNKKIRKNISNINFDIFKLIINFICQLKKKIIYSQFQINKLGKL